LWQNGLLDAVWGGELGRSRDGVLDGDGDRRGGRGSFEGKCGASNCNQKGLCGVVRLFSAVRGGDAALPKYFDISC